MIGLDTNVVIRYITQDDPVQSAKATKLIESFSADKPGFIAMISVVELVWVVQSCYCASKDTITHMLESLLRTEEIVVEHADLVWQALRQYNAAAQADFADCLIERCAHAAGCSYTVTFDRTAVKAAGMKSL